MKSGLQAKTSGTSIIAAQRRAEMLRLRVQGLTLEQVGEVMNIKSESVHGVISRALRTIVKEPSEELLALELERCDALLVETMHVVMAFHPLVNCGQIVRAVVEDKNGRPMFDEITGKVLIQTIEDKAPKLAAINTALRVMDRRAKLLGLDKPFKTTPNPLLEGTSKPSVVFYIPANNRD